MAALTTRISVPGDKSISHRALILAALARGESRIRGLLDSADVRSTAAVLAACGVHIEATGAGALVHGRGRRSLVAPAGPLDCGNSGTTARLMAGVVAGHPFQATFVGDASLSRRPMRRVAAPLTAMGADVECAPHGGLPMRVRGAELHDVEWTSEVPSAQVKSAILLAALVSGVRARVQEPAASRDHTERMLAAFGATVSAGPAIEIAPGQELTARDITVPGDPSSAAFLAAAAALGLGDVAVPGVCANPTRTRFFDCLAAMGADVAWESRRDEAGEPVADLRVAAATTLRPIEVGPADVPALVDELPMLACLAANADGETVVSGAAELRVKESDRISAVVSNLRAVGGDAEELPDGFRIRGARRPLRGRVVTHGDHRIAMAFGVLAAIPGNDVAIDDRECVEVSYPAFWRDLQRIARA